MDGVRSVLLLVGLVIIAVFSVGGYAAWVYGVKDYLLSGWINEDEWTASYKEVAVDIAGAVGVLAVAGGIVKMILSGG